MKRYRVLLLLLSVTAATALFASCQDKNATERARAKPSETAHGAARDGGKPAGPAPLGGNIVKLNAKGFQDFSVDPAPFRTKAHKVHLADPMQFRPFPDQGLSRGQTAVVGSEGCVLYPKAQLGSAADLDRLPAGIPIPFGTIIPIEGEKIRNPTEKERYGMFQFQDNWNWFYSTTYNGQEGIVFGADLYGLEDTNEDNRISARLYGTGGKYDNFHPAVGYHPIPPAIAERIERDRLAIQAVRSDEYDLRGYRSDLMPDDMVALYAKHSLRYGSATDAWRRKTPIFVTTDLAAHAQHLMFDRTLQYLEEAYFLPRLKALNEAFLTALTARESEATDYRESFDKAVLYFKVAQALLALAPERVFNPQDDYGADPVVYRDQNVQEVLSAYPEEVRAEVGKILEAKGVSLSSVFSFKDGTQSKEDYSQYKPRGHYTKNGALSAYFRAMMWFGRVHFIIASEGNEPLPDASGQSSDTIALTLAMEPIALLITDLARGDEALYKSWRALFDPITDLIGLSDDLSFEELIPLWRDERVSEKEFGSWAGDKEKLLAFMRKAHDNLRPPAISGFSVFWGPSEGPDRKPPMGWRLFGQRFTYDSAIHQAVSPPRLMSRDMVRGLDVLKAFGSRTADSLLEASDYPKMAGLKEKLDGLEAEFNSYGGDFWKKTYYNSVLFQVKTQAQFEPGAGFYFTEGAGWGNKAMLSAHGTWSELRHDTILYAKQAAAERAGDGDFDPTFRTKPIPDPVHYIEPNLSFWQGSALSVQLLLKTLDGHALLDEQTAQAFSRLQEIYAKAARIVQLEAEDKTVAPEDVKWIATIPNELVHLVLLHVEGGDILDEDQLRMALVADVFTNYELGRVLETAVGIPYRIYVPLNDSQGGKRIAVGYVFSYYEFEAELSGRMTDEEWKAIVYDPDARLGKYEPFWSRDLVLPYEPAKIKK